MSLWRLTRDGHVKAPETEKQTINIGSVTSDSNSTRTTIEDEALYIYEQKRIPEPIRELIPDEWLHHLVPSETVCHRCSTKLSVPLCKKYKISLAL